LRTKIKSENPVKPIKRVTIQDFTDPNLLATWTINNSIEEPKA